jgi:hypothetical protein
MKYVLGIMLGLLLFASVAKADGFNPADVYPGEVVFDLTKLVVIAGFPPAEINYAIEVVDVSPEGAEFWGFCTGPNPLVAFPYCSTDEPIGVFEPAGSTFDIAKDVFGFDPGLSVTTPEPSTGGLLFVAACFLCAFGALGRRMA